MRRLMRVALLTAVYFVLTMGFFMGVLTLGMGLGAGIWAFPWDFAWVMAVLPCPARSKAP